MMVLQYAIAVCPVFAFPKALGHISYCRISFPHSINILALSTSIITADPYIY